VSEIFLLFESVTRGSLGLYDQWELDSLTSKVCLKFSFYLIYATEVHYGDMISEK
jgi:hypothetical protein